MHHQGEDSGATLVASKRRDERLVKSMERVRDLGEVFTPAHIVNEMLDLLPEDTWRHHPSPTFLEPACGDGNFLVAILQRKLDTIARDLYAGSLSAGQDDAAIRFHTLEAVASIYAVDISNDNVIGGTPGHEVGARQRLIIVLRTWYEGQASVTLDEDDELIRSAQWIVDRNILIGNMLEFNPDGTSSGRDDLPILEYKWEPDDATVKISKTTLGAVASEAESETATMPSLFGPTEPHQIWVGPALDVHKIADPAPLCPTVPEGNGANRRTGSPR